MEWKKIVKVILRILWMLRLVTPPEENPCPPQKRKKKDETDDQPPAAVPPMSLKSASDATAAEHVGATYSSNCSKLLPRWQVLSLLQWDCLHSERRIDLLVLHCSDTRPTQQYSIQQLQRDHQRRGFGPWPGYHIYVRRDGGLYYCRPVTEAGCHAKGFNLHSIGICYEGGRSTSADVRHEDNRTAEQVEVLDEVLRTLHAIYPEARLVGHHELNPLKACPCLSPPTAEQYAYIFGKPLRRADPPHGSDAQSEP